VIVDGGHYTATVIS